MKNTDLAIQIIQQITKTDFEILLLIYFSQQFFHCSLITYTKTAKFTIIKRYIEFIQ